MINPVQFLKKSWSGILSILLGIYILVSIKNISKIDLVTGLWCLTQSVYLAGVWYRKRNATASILMGLDVLFAIPLLLDLYQANIPMIYMIISFLILNAVSLFNQFYSKSRNNIVLMALLFFLIVLVLLLIFYPWLKKIAWLTIFAIFIITYGITSIVANNDN